jgi:hypothetical protein
MDGQAAGRRPEGNRTSTLFCGADRGDSTNEDHFLLPGGPPKMIHPNCGSRRKGCNVKK